MTEDEELVERINRAVREAMQSPVGQQALDNAVAAAQTTAKANSSTGSSKKEWTDPELMLDHWHKYEEIAMHFNDLLIRFRTQALGGLAAVIAIGAGFVKEAKGPAAIDLPVFFGVLWIFWIALWVLDRYYAGLLEGAVGEITKFEAATDGRILMSTKIESTLRGGRASCIAHTFYALIAVGLVVLAGGTLWQAMNPEAKLATAAVPLPVTFTVDTYLADKKRDASP
jgi:hypothetical protein